MHDNNSYRASKQEARDGVPRVRCADSRWLAGTGCRSVADARFGVAVVSSSARPVGSTTGYEAGSTPRAASLPPVSHAARSIPRYGSCPRRLQRLASHIPPSTARPQTRPRRGAHPSRPNSTRENQAPRECLTVRSESASMSHPASVCPTKAGAGEASGPSSGFAGAVRWARRQASASDRASTHRHPAA